MDEQVGTVYTLKGRWQERSPKPYRHSILPNQLPGSMQVFYIYIYCLCIPSAWQKTSDGEVIDPVKA